ncbi:MAG: DUF3488 and transglutaminase-like domain-containing protein [Rubrivivax sp.]
MKPTVRLTREARDTLFLLAVIGWTLLPHAAHVPLWCSVLAAAILGWRAWLAVGNRPLPGRGALIALLLAAGALTFWSERTLLGKEAGVTLIVVLMTLKTLELRARRDALVVFFLGFFVVLTNFLYSQSLLVAASMLLSVWGLLTALVLAHMPVGRPPLAAAGTLAARAALLGAPVMLVLFLLFPRIGPLWGVPEDAAGRTGLSGTMRLGGVASVANDETIALRVRFDGAPPPPEAMYFRGPVLGRFDGVDWTRSPDGPVGARVQVLGAPRHYEMTLEPSRLAMLPLLELTPAAAGPQLDGWSLRLRQDLQWQLDRPLADRVRLQATAWTDYRHGPRTATPALDDFRRLPPGYNPRTLAWAQALHTRPDLAGADARTLAAALLRHVADGGYGYTLEPGPYGRDAIDEFWLDRKLGFCEHFAAAFVVAMRAMGVPARIVTGYQGTDPAPADGWWIVRQSNAHAWAEYWQPGAGWQRADPTAAVAPERVQRGRSLPPAPGFVAGTIGAVNPALAARLREAWETIDNRWNQAVLNYSRQNQFDLLRALGVESPDWEDLARALVVLAALASAAGAGWALWDRHRQDPWQRLQARVQRALATRGVEVGPQHGPRARAERVRAALGTAGEPLAAELEALDRLRYGDGVAQPARRWWPGFAKALRQVGRP